MMKFSQWLKEDDSLVIETAVTPIDGSPSLQNPEVIDNLNSRIFQATDDSFVTPYVALEYIRKVVAWAGIQVPAVLSLDGQFGEQVFKLEQFGVEPNLDQEPFYLYFCWELNDSGQYNIFAQIVAEEELLDLLDDNQFYEDETPEE